MLVYWFSNASVHAMQVLNPKQTDFVTMEDPDRSIFKREGSFHALETDQDAINIRVSGERRKDFAILQTEWKIPIALSSCSDMCYSVNSLFTRMAWTLHWHGMYEITPAHQPLSSSLFQPYSSTSRSPSLRCLYPPVLASSQHSNDCPLYFRKLFCFSIFFCVDPWLTSPVSSIPDTM